MALGEWLFQKFIGKLPLPLYGMMDKDLRVLAQPSGHAIDFELRVYWVLLLACFLGTPASFTLSLSFLS
jgi:hypothetical protein